MPILQGGVCEHAEIEHVRKFVAYAKHHVNNTRYYPPLNGYRYMVALALYSKSFTVAEATMALLDAGFNDEAFGITRTLADIYITLRYIANQDTEERAKLYFNFVAKDVVEWVPVVKDFWPHLAQPIDPRLAPTAATYPSPHRWSGRSAREMAVEPDMHEMDVATGMPAVHDFDYRVVYRWTSHYVHPSMVSLRNHLVTPGHDPFVVHSGHEQGPHCNIQHRGVCGQGDGFLLSLYGRSPTDAYSYLGQSTVGTPRAAAQGGGVGPASNTAPK